MRAVIAADFVPPRKIRTYERFWDVQKFAFSAFLIVLDTVVRPME